MKVNTTDELFIDAPPDEVYRALVTLGKDASWWPGARTSSRGKEITVSAPVQRLARVRFGATVDGVRPDEGLTWWLKSGELHGRAEWWLEKFKAGTIVHYFLDVEPGEGWRPMQARVRRHRWAVRRGINALKDNLEVNRA